MREVREGFGVQISCAAMRGEEESLVSSAVTRGPLALPVHQDLRELC